MDVKWNPVNPSIFASGDAEGFIDIWDLTKDIEAPIIHHKAGIRLVKRQLWNQ